MKDYNAPFKNSAIDRLGSKFGDPDKPKVEGPINLTGVQNALNRGIASVKRAASSVSNVKINKPRVEKTSTIIYDEMGGPIGRENSSKRFGVIGNKSTTRKETINQETGNTTYSKSVTNPKGGKMIEVNKTVTPKGDFSKTRTRYNTKGDVMTSRSRSKQGKFFQ